MKAGLLLGFTGWTCAVALAGLGHQATAATAEPKPVQLVTRETVIARPHILVDPESLVVSPDARRVAFTALRGRQRTVWVDGVEQGTYDRVEPLHFSPDGKRLAFWALRQGKHEMVADGRAQSKPYDGCWAWRSTELIVTNGTLEFAATSRDAVFSPDSRHLAYVGASRADGRPRPHVLRDGDEMGVYEGLVDCGLVFSPDSRRLAYVASEGTNSVVMIDGQPHRAYAEGAALTPTGFGADGQRLAYFATKGGKHWVAVDGKEVGPFDQVGVASLRFSPDSRRLAFTFGRGERAFLWLDGREEGGFENLAGLAFSPDSQKFAYCVVRSSKWLVTVNGTEGKPYDGITGLVAFSPDSKRMAYAARRGENAFAVVDGREGKPYQGAQELRLRFSPDSRRLAYAVHRPGRSLVVVDAAEGPEYDAIFEFVFTSPSSIRFLARRYDALAQAEIVRVEMDIRAE